MKLWVRLAAASAALSLGFAASAQAEAPAPLSDSDSQHYSQAFAAADRGDFATAETEASKAKDRSLLGRLQLTKLTKAPATAFADLTAWLKSYGDQAGADRVYNLALKKKPRKAAAPKAPAVMAAAQLIDTPTKVSLATPKGKKAARAAAQARSAYYGGDIKRALTLSVAGGERWIAGLASFRLNRFGPAETFFKAVAKDTRQDEWLRSAAAFWAARAADEAGDAAAVPGFLQLAAQAPHTFYGMIAERQLELANPTTAPSASDPIDGLLQKASLNAQPDLSAGLVAKDARAHRAAALAQIGRTDDAGLELRNGLALAKTALERQAWIALGAALGAGGAPTESAWTVKPTVWTPTTADYPMPDLAPTGGFTIDRAMVYALVRQESRFNPLAVSGAGAVGLMQLMPEAAARAAGDDKLKRDTSPLFDPATNLRVGQDYFTWLMERGLNDYDVLRAVAAYNGGAGSLLKTAAQLGQDCDSLMLIESLPALETRNYVERVMAAYWSYRKILGGDTKTLDALAQGARTVDFRLDGAGA